jgi:hypothetical protein
MDPSNQNDDSDVSDLEIEISEHISELLSLEELSEGKKFNIEMDKQQFILINDKKFSLNMLSNDQNSSLKDSVPFSSTSTTYKTLNFNGKFV